jgi:hypothetical protein
LGSDYLGPHDPRFAIFDVEAGILRRQSLAGDWCGFEAYGGDAPGHLALCDYLRGDTACGAYKLENCGACSVGLWYWDERPTRVLRNWLFDSGCFITNSVATSVA